MTDVMNSINIFRLKLIQIGWDLDNLSCSCILGAFLAHHLFRTDCVSSSFVESICALSYLFSLHFRDKQTRSLMIFAATDISFVYYDISASRDFSSCDKLKGKFCGARVLFTVPRTISVGFN